MKHNSVHKCVHVRVYVRTCIYMLRIYICIENVVYMYMYMYIYITGYVYT